MKLKIKTKATQTDGLTTWNITEVHGPRLAALARSGGQAGPGKESKMITRSMVPHDKITGRACGEQAS